MQVGDIVDGRYRLLDLLGEGAAGKVFRCEDLAKNNMFVALKLLHAKDPRWENFFRREFEVLSRLHHPNLVSVYDFGPAPEENTWYFTQELVVGKPLLETVAGKKIDEVVALFVEICRALEFIHGHGVLHRDLKPANILVQQHAEPGERVRVLDFGLWRELDPTPQRGARWAGTPPYLASEVLRGFGHSISADLYAVGVTLFQVLTRKLPHGRGTPQELLQARKTPAPDLSPMVRKELAAVIARLLDEVPESRPQSAAEVAAALSQVIPNHAIAMPLALGRARLVGRDTEKSKLAELVEAVRERRPNSARLVLIEGPDGVGKSRFVNELKAEVQLKGGRSAVGACTEEVRTGYRPVADLARMLAPLAGRAHLTESEKEVIERLLPEVAGTGHQAAGGNELGSMAKAERDRFHDAAVDLFLGLGGPTVCVLIIEDVPYCDTASTALVARMVSRAKEASLLVVVTAAEAQGPVPPEIVAAAKGEVLRVKLEPLARDAVGKLVCSLLGVATIPEALIETMFAHSRGSPLMVEELLALMIDRGDLRRGDSGWLLDELAKQTVASAPLLGVLQERLQRLSDAERKTLSALAVFNRPSGPKLLAAVSGLEIEKVRQALSTCEGHGLIRVVDEEDGRPRVVFRHPNIRDALLQRLQEKGELAKAHRTCGEVLEARSKSNLPPVAETLANHYDAAGDVERAVRMFCMAAEHAIHTFAFEHAVSLAHRAVRLIDKSQGDDVTAARANLLVGKAMLLSGKPADARSSLEASLSRTNPDKAPEALGDMHLWLSRAYRALGQADLGKSAVDQALALLKPEKQPVAVARLLLARGEVLRETDASAALTDAARARELFGAKAAVDDVLRVDELVTVAALNAGRPQQALEAAKRRVELAEQEGRELDEIPARRMLAETHAANGDRLAARHSLNAALELAKKHGHKVEEALLTKALGEELYVSGAYGEAIARFQRATTLAAQLSQIADRAESLRMIGRAYYGKGEYDRALDHLRAAADAFDKLGALGSLIIARTDVALTLLAKGNIAEAEEQLRGAAKRLKSDGLDEARAHVLLAQGMLFTQNREWKKARKAFLYAAALRRRNHRAFALGEVLAGYGQLLLRVREHKRALRMARRAEWIFTDLDARGQLKRITPLLNAADGLSKSGSHDDGSKVPLK
ncbi:MAG: protein kinase [Deltaproteobacteria bacterium]|nr:protein kinase [Deltaproteobacteria bacterium]